MNGRNPAARRRSQLHYDDTLSLAYVMDQTRRRATAAENCTLKIDNVCSKFLKDSIPVPEGIPSTPAVSYIEVEGAGCSRMILRYFPDPVLVPMVLQDGADTTERIRTQFQDNIRIRPCKIKSVSGSSSVVPKCRFVCQEEQDVTVKFRSSRFYSSSHCHGSTATVPLQSSGYEHLHFDVSISQVTNT